MRHSTERCHGGTEVHLKKTTDRWAEKNGGIPWWSLKIPGRSLGSLVFGCLWSFSIIFQWFFLSTSNFGHSTSKKKLRFFVLASGLAEVVQDLLLDGLQLSDTSFSIMEQRLLQPGGCQFCCEMVDGCRTTHQSQSGTCWVTKNHLKNPINIPISLAIMLHLTIAGPLSLRPPKNMSGGSCPKLNPLCVGAVSPRSINLKPSSSIDSTTSELTTWLQPPRTKNFVLIECLATLSSDFSSEKMQQY